MKKMRLNLFFASALIALTASAQEQNDATFSGSMLYGFCTTAYSSNTFGTGTTAGEAMQLTESAIKYFTGCKITAVAVANGAQADNSTATTMPITVFIADKLDGEYTTTVSGEMDLTKPLEYKEYALETPIEITPGMSPIFAGFTVVCDNSVGYPLVTDGQAPASGTAGDWIGRINDGKWVWEQIGAYVGSGCVRLKIEGSRLPANNVAILESHIPTYAAPGSTANVGLYLRNDAGNPVSSVTVSYTVNGTEGSTVVDIPSPLIYNEYTAMPVIAKINVPETEGADLPFEIDITGINATNAANNAVAADRQANGTYLSLTNGYDKAMVVEIGTGTWCGWCPMGFDGVSKMREAYPDGRFIPIAVHINDGMSESSYSRFSTEYAHGNAPMCVINRNTTMYGTQNPTFRFLNTVYPEVIAEPAAVNPQITNVTLNAETKRLTVDASAEFALSTEGEYAFAYVLTESNVGPYQQHNYYSPEIKEQSGAGALEWWDEQPEYVNVLFGDVARQIYSFYGVKNSLPEAIEKGKTYTHSASLQTNLVDNIENCDITLMITNRKSGRIENAVRVPYSKFSSIESVEADVNSAADNVFYDIQGRRVANPSAGHIYIVNGKKIRL